MPYKYNASRRHRIQKMKFKVTNWAEYEAGLRRRGSLTLGLTPEALAGWHAPRRTTRGGQPRDSDLAIETVLTLGCVFGLRLRQSEGLMTSLLDPMGLDLPVPDQDADDPSQVGPLLDRIAAEIDQFTADGAYDGDPTYCTVLKHSATAKIVIPPRSTAVESDDTGPPGQGMITSGRSPKTDG